MSKDIIKIPAYEKYLADAQLALINEIERYKNEGYLIIGLETHENDENKIKSAIVSNPTIISSKDKRVNIERIKLEENPSYLSFDYWIEAPSYYSEGQTEKPFTTSIESFEASLNSKELYPSEKEAVENNPLYQFYYSGKSFGDNQ